MAAHGTTKRGQSIQKWESSDFPIVCETCLGDNPYLRMTREEAGKECKICARPFTIFRWKPGVQARYKKTEICQTCAKLKNVCQTCLLDLEYGLPVQVRDTALVNPESIPVSDVNREWFAEQAERRIEAGQLPYGKAPLVSQVLSKLARTTPYYKRNAPHICSFFVKGECNRGDTCPYRHEKPEENELSKQRIKDRYYGVNDPVALKLLKKAENIEPEPPADPSITTVFLGGVTPAINELDIRDAFYSFGEIKAIRVVHKSSCAFVTFAERASADAAIRALHRKLVIKGVPIKVSWGRPQTFDPQAPTVGGGFVGQAATYGLSFAASPALPPPPPLPGAGPVAPYYPSMDPNLMGSRPSVRPREDGGFVAASPNQRTEAPPHAVP